MLKRFSAKNFRSWRDVELTFSKGINVIWGGSQDGKTNCTFRLVRLVKDNRPSSASFYSNFAPDKGSTIVEIETYEGRTVSVVKSVEVKRDKESGKKVKKLLSTEYTHDRRKKPFAGVGVNVPDEIVDILNLGELNIQDQNDKSFLITETPGEVARTINRITKLDRADEWIKDLNTRIGVCNKEITVLIGDPDKDIIGKIKEIEIELFKYENIDKIGNYIDRAGRLELKIDKKEKEVEGITRIVGQLGVLDDEIDILEKVLEADKYLEKAVVIEEKIESLENEEDIIKEYLFVCDEYADIESDGKELKEDVEKIKNWYEKADGFDERIEVLSDERDLISDYYTVYEEVEDLFCKREEGKKELSVLLNEMGKCPLCFGVIDAKCIERILKEI